MGKLIYNPKTMDNTEAYRIFVLNSKKVGFWRTQFSADQIGAIFEFCSITGKHTVTFTEDSRVREQNWNRRVTWANRDKQSKDSD